MADPLNPDDRLTRDAAAKALTEAGYPTRTTTLATKVSRGGGPTYRLYAGRAIYLWADLLAWAESRVTEPRCNSSEVDLHAPSSEVSSSGQTAPYSTDHG